LEIAALLTRGEEDSTLVQTRTFPVNSSKKLAFSGGSFSPCGTEERYSCGKDQSVSPVDYCNQAICFYQVADFLSAARMK
jgi:hypothetical protein